jgi:hypothetical protein
MNELVTLFIVFHKKKSGMRPGVSKWYLPLAISVVLALSVLCAVSVGRPFLDAGMYLLIHHASPRYDYSGYSAHLPSRLRVGETLNTAWLSYAHTQESASGGPRPVLLRTLLVDEYHWKRGMCGNYQAAVILDSIATDDRSGFPYLFGPTKQVRIPFTVSQGNYYFVQEVRLRTTASCGSNPLHIDP